MPSYIVTGPDGRKFRVDDVASEQAATSMIMSEIYGRDGSSVLQQTAEAVKGLIPGAVTLGEMGVAGAASLLPEEYEKAVRDKTAEVAESIKESELLKAEQGYEDSFGRKAGEALGSTLPFFGAAALGRFGPVGAAALGVASGAGEARMRAEEEGASQEARAKATAAGSVVGAAEIFAPLRMIDRMPDGVKKILGDRLGNILITGGEEAAQEAAAQLAQNAIAKGLYKPDQELIEGLGEEAAYGGVAGALSTALIQMAMGRRAKPTTPEEREQAPKTETEQLAGGEEEQDVDLEQAVQTVQEEGQPVTTAPTPTRKKEKEPSLDIASLVNQNVDVSAANEITVPQNISESKKEEFKNIVEEVKAGKGKTGKGKTEEVEAGEVEAVEFTPDDRKLAIELLSAAGLDPRTIPRYMFGKALEQARQTRITLEKQQAEQQAAELAAKQAAESAANQAPTTATAPTVDLDAVAEFMVANNTGNFKKVATGLKVTQREAKEFVKQALAQGKVYKVGSGDYISTADFAELRDLGVQNGKLAGRADADGNTGGVPKFVREEEAAESEATKPIARAVVSAGGDATVPYAGKRKREPTLKQSRQFLLGEIEQVRQSIPATEDFMSDLLELSDISDAVEGDIESGVFPTPEDLATSRERLSSIKSKLSEYISSPYGRGADVDPDLLSNADRGKSGSGNKGMIDLLTSISENSNSRVISSLSRYILSDVYTEAESEITDEVAKEMGMPNKEAMEQTFVPPKKKVGEADSVYQERVARAKNAFMAPRIVGVSDKQTATPVEPYQPKTEMKKRWKAAGGKERGVQSFRPRVIVEGKTTDAKDTKAVEEIKKSGNSARYNYKDNTLIFAKEGLTDNIVMHEIVHAYTFQTIRQYDVDKSKLTPEQRRGVDSVIRIFNQTKETLAKKHPLAYANKYEFVAYAMTEAKFQEELASITVPSKDTMFTDFSKTILDVKEEKLSAKGRKILLNRIQKYMADNPKKTEEEARADLGIDEDMLTTQIKRTKRSMQDMWTKFSRAIAEILGIAPAKLQGNALIEVTEAVSRIMTIPKAKLDRSLLEGGIEDIIVLNAGRRSYQAPIDPDDKSIVEMRLEAQRRETTKTSPIKSILEQVKSPNAYENLLEKYQNQQRWLTKIQNDLKQTGTLVFYGPNANNIASRIYRTPNISAYDMKTVGEPAVEKLLQSVAKYAESKGITYTVDEAQAQLDAYRIALHEAERRRVQFAKKVKLDNVKTYSFFNGAITATPAELRFKLETELSKLNAQHTGPDGKLTPAGEQMAKFIGSQLYNLAEAKNPDGKFKYHDPKAKSDINDDFYNVIPADYSMARIQEELNKLNDPEEKALVDDFLAASKEIQDLSTEFNRKSGYWNSGVDAIVASYGWKNYTPYKGLPNAAAELDYDSQRVSGELSDSTDGFDGRNSDFDSPTIRTIEELEFAIKRNARIKTGVMDVIKNLINQDIISVTSKKGKKFTFEERNARGFDINQLKGRNKILFHNEDGSIDVFTLTDPRQVEAIKGTYQTMGRGQTLVNSANRAVAQFHTKYNPAFPPMDFVRNSLTNATWMYATDNPELAKEYVYQVSENVFRFGFKHSWRVSMAYAAGDTSKLNSFKNEGGFAADVVDYIENGGRTVYRQGVELGTALDSIKEYVNEDGIIKQEGFTDTLRRYAEAYNDAFEFTSRVAAYTVKRDELLQKLANDGVTVTPAIEKEVKAEASAFALDLLNFRQAGSNASWLRTLFMFFTPSASSVAKTLDAVMPGLVSEQTALNRLDPRIVKQMTETPKGDKEEQADYDARIAKARSMRAEFSKNYKEANERVQTLGVTLFLVGAGLYAIARAGAGEDDEGRNLVHTDDKSRWVRYLRMPNPFGEQPIQIPWGFGMNGIMSFGAQVAALASGDQSFRDFMGNSYDISLDTLSPLPISRVDIDENNLLKSAATWLVDSISPSLVKPLIQLAANTDPFGNQIFSQTSSKYTAGYGSGTRSGELFTSAARWAETELPSILPSKFLPDEVDPNVMKFILSNYFDAPTHIVNNFYNLSLWAKGEKDLDPKTDLMVLRSFFGAPANYDADRFSKVKSEIESWSRRINTIKLTKNSEAARRFLNEHPNGEAILEQFNRLENGRLRDIYMNLNKVRTAPNLTAKQREAMMDELEKQRDAVYRAIIRMYEVYEEDID